MKKVSVSLLIIISITVIVSGCSGNESPISSLTATQIIDNSSEKMQAINSFHFILEQEGGGTPIAMGIEMKKAFGDVVRPDKLKMTISGTIAGMTLKIQMVSTGSIMYITNPLSGKWEIPPKEFQILSVLDPYSFIASVMKDVVSPERFSDEESGGVPCYHLTGSIDSGVLKAITGIATEGESIDTEIWVGKDDFLIRTVKLKGKITETEEPGIIRFLRLSDFNEELNIELPEVPTTSVWRTGD